MRHYCRFLSMLAFIKHYNPFEESPVVSCYCSFYLWQLNSSPSNAAVLGKLAVSASTETKSEFELSYIKIEINDKEHLEIDKFNFICKIDGIDYLAQVRGAWEGSMK